jgi:hypothetical protein
MLVSEMKMWIAKELGILSSDGTTILSKKITGDDIVNRIQFVNREVLFPILSNAFPLDYTNHSYSQQTYIAAGVVDSSSTGTTLVCTSDIFTNGMEGFTVQNITDGSSTKLKTYVSANSYIVEGTIADTWDGDSIVIVGNEYTFGGMAADLKELAQVRIKYSPNDNDWTVCTVSKRNREIRYGGEAFSRGDPIAYLDSILVDGELKAVVGFLPYPDNYLGVFEADYIAKPAILTEAQEPILSNQGICPLIINGVIAWGLELLGQTKKAKDYLEKDPRTGFILPMGTLSMINFYRPFFRSGAKRIRQSDYYNAIANHDI